MGGNLIGGWAHARDLMYVSELVKAYHTDRKVFETLHLAEQCGINTILTNPLLARVINDYWRRDGREDPVHLRLRLQGRRARGGEDLHRRRGERLLRPRRDRRQPGEGGQVRPRSGRRSTSSARTASRRGIGGHQLETVQACVAAASPDFWMKTLHHRNYWSAAPDEQNDNIWCENPEETMAYMRALPQPWIAFKVLAAGAIHPRRASGTRSRTVPTSSASECTTSRSWRTSTSPSPPWATRRSGPGAGSCAGFATRSAWRGSDGTRS